MTRRCLEQPPAPAALPTDEPETSAAPAYHLDVHYFQATPAADEVTWMGADHTLERAPAPWTPGPCDGSIRRAT